VLGGTAISQVYKYAKDKSQLVQLREFCDAVVIGEGETAICEIAASAGRLRETGNLTNTIVFRREADPPSLPLQIRYEDLNLIGAPVYAHPWELYLSPERGINYSPTRGCYWNRCTFCDYGLNTDSPTSPWRERKIDLVIEDLEMVHKEWGVNYIYFAVDVMAPSYLDRLSKAILGAGLDIHWSAELRMERVYSTDRCETMAKAGCVSVSFGMESGSQRVLDLIDKGTKVSYMAETMKNFGLTGVAVQLMAFQGFPTESAEDRKETYKFIEQNSPHYSTGGIGKFQLTGTSIVAKNPERFGIKVIETQDADIARSLLYLEGDGPIRNGLLPEEYDASFNDTGGIFPEVLRRPWAGGIDALHSIIYYHKHGRRFFKSKAAALYRQKQTIENCSEALQGVTIEINGKLAEAQYDLAEIVKHQHLFQQYLKMQDQAHLEPTYARFEKTQNNIPAIDQSITKNNYWIISDHGCIKINKAIYDFLFLISTYGLSIGQAVAGVRPDVKEKLLSYLNGLVENDFVSVVSASAPGKN
jgi:anaerobic magnesium-protoporphyrin IX monomethyl ester cyclase